MAVSVNTVYQTVLYILNKEQRGYITPAEFNSLAAQVQQEIFESYFPDGNQVNRFNQNNTQNDTEFFNIFKNISYKLYPFIKEVLFSYNNSSKCFYNNTNSTIYNIGEVITTYAGQPQYSSTTQLVSQKDFNKITRSKLTLPTKQHPIFKVKNENNNDADYYVSEAGAGYVNGANHSTTGGTGSGLQVTVTVISPSTSVASVVITDYGSGYSVGDVLTIAGGTTSAKIVITPITELALQVSPDPGSSGSLNVNCVLNPSNPTWDFTTGQVGQYIFNAVGNSGSSSVNFELDISEQSNLVTNVLKYCGIIINDPLIIQAAAQEAQAVQVNEKS